jgi:hypothetical protein
MLGIEAGLVLLAILIAFVAPKLGSSWFDRIESRVVRLSRRRGLSVALVGLAAIVARISVLPLLPVPYPGNPDEFGHLFAADTFAHFRVTNPTHAMWVHFENFSEIQQPSHASKYPPAQGLILAVGQVVFGHPFWGVCLSVGLMCAAICWMLQAWLPPQWAFIGGLLAILRLGMFSYWANSYWGGAIAALGGALVLGAFPRLRAHQRPRDALIMGIGLAVLGNSRPYEGLAVSLPIIILLAAGVAKLNSADRRRAVIRIAFPLSACLTFTLVFMGYYCWRITGNPLRTPYQVSQATYYPTPLFLWQPLPRTPTYRHPFIQRHMENWEMSVYRGGREHPILMAEARVFFFSLFFLGPALGVPVLLLPYAIPYRFSWKDLSSDTQTLVVIALLSAIAGLLPLFFNPGYAAPVTAALYALILKTVRRLRSLRLGHGSMGIAFTRWLAVVCLALIGVRAAAVPLHLQLYGPRSWFSLNFQLTERSRLEAKLSREPERNLVIVRNAAANPELETEWVFNDADIDQSKVVWARDMGPERNTELINYFKDRRAWLVETNAGPAKLSRYPD